MCGERMVMERKDGARFLDEGSLVAAALCVSRARDLGRSVG